MPDKIPVLFFQLFLLLVLFCSRGYAVAPMIYGVTQDSVYVDEFVRIYWFEPDGVATLTHNGTSHPYNSGTAIENDGSYSIELSVNKDGQTLSNSVAFQINTSQTVAHLQTLENNALTGLTIDFTPDSYSGNPIIVIWTEDMAGNFLQNLYVSTAAATNYMRFTNNIVNRPQAVPYWAHKTCPPMAAAGGGSLHVAQPEIPLPDGLDAVSGATQKLGFSLNSHVQAAGNQNQIKVLLEINQSYDDGWYFAAGNPLREETDIPSGTTFGDDPYYSGSNEPSLIYSVDVNLDQPGTYTTGEPAGYGHYGGRTGTLYTDFFALDGTTERHKFDVAIRMVDQLSVTVHKLPGDINGDHAVDLLDAIIGLQICTGSSHPINRNSDINSNGLIGMEEVMLVLRHNAF